MDRRLHPSGIWKAQQSPDRASVEAVLSGWLEVDVCGLHLLSLRVPHIFEPLPFGAHYLVVNVSDQLLGGLSESGSEWMNQGSVPSSHTPNSYLLGSHGSVNLLILCTVHHHVPAKHWLREAPATQEDPRVQPSQAQTHF